MKEQSIERRESLVDIARTAGISVPTNLYDSYEKFPHWDLFCSIQIERPIHSDDEALHNARIIAAIPANRLLSVEKPFWLGEICNQLK
jgi:hypothetical protein